MRPIDADALKNAFEEDGHLSGYIEEFIDDMPTLDVAPVVHGRWVYDPNAMDWNLGGYVCSRCGVRNNNLPGDLKYNPLMFSGSTYCPNCGARMDLED